MPASTHQTARPAEAAPANRRSRRRRRILLGCIAAALVAILVIGMAGIITTNHPTPGPSGRYGTDGSGYINLPHLATIWLSVTLTDLIAILAVGLFATSVIDTD